LNSGEIETCNFQIYYPNDFQKIKIELIAYYKSEKLDFNNLTNILGIEKKEIEEFKSQMKSTTANTC